MVKQTKLGDFPPMTLRRGPMAKWNLDKLSNVNQKGTTMAKTISKNNCTYVRTEILRKANVCVMEDRAADHGDMENNFKTISDLWSTFLDIDISPSQVGMLMCLLKIARQKSNPKHADNYIDLAGYAACTGELSADKPEPEVKTVKFQGGNT